MRRLIILNSETDFTSHAEIALIGMALDRCTNLGADADAVGALRKDGIGHRTILSCYVALLCLGKSDFEAIEGVRNEEFFFEALDLDRVPSAATLRQRMDAHAESFKPVAEEAAIEFLVRSEAEITPLGNGSVPVDADVTPMINAKTKKEGVSRTYKGEDGFAPIAAYIGQEGYCLGLELRAGKQH